MQRINVHRAPLALAHSPILFDACAGLSSEALTFKEFQYEQQISM